MILLCVICLHVRPDRPRLAGTVANGQAVCQDHLLYVTGWPELDTAVSIAKGNEEAAESEDPVRH